MTDEQKAAYVIAQASAAMVEAMGMAAENAYRQSCGHSIAYGEDAFNAVIEKYGVHNNAIVSFFHD